MASGTTSPALSALAFSHHSLGQCKGVAAGNTVDALHRTGGILVDGRRYSQSATRCTSSASPACASQGGEGMLSHVRKAKACGLPDGARSGQLLTDQNFDGRGLPLPFAQMTATWLTCDTVRFTSTIVGLSFAGYWKSSLVMRRTTLLRLFAPSRGPIFSLLSSKYAFFSGYFSTNMVGVLPFHSLEGLQLPVLEPPDVPRASDQWAHPA